MDTAFVCKCSAEPAFTLLVFERYCFECCIYTPDVVCLAVFAALYECLTLYVFWLIVACLWIKKCIDIMLFAVSVRA